MTHFMEIQTAELTGGALDWAVAQIDEVKTIMLSPKGAEPKKPFALFGSLALPIGDGEQGYAPSTCWHCGGPLLTKFNINITVECKGLFFASACDESGMPVMSGDISGAFGPTHLIAACRAIVASVLGETVSVPKELV